MKREPKPALSLLVIDDNKELLRALRMTLDILGHRVTTCPDGASAKVALAGQAFDVVVCDLRLGDEDGTDILRQARAALPQARLVAMSGGDIPLGGQVLADAGGGVVPLIKPFNHEELMTALGI